jgi:hypothetical protein
VCRTARSAPVRPSHRSAGTEGLGLEPWPTCFETDTRTRRHLRIPNEPTTGRFSGTRTRASCARTCSLPAGSARDSRALGTPGQLGRRQGDLGSHALCTSRVTHRPKACPALSCPCVRGDAWLTCLAPVAKRCDISRETKFVKTSRCLRAGPAWMGATRSKNELIILRCLFFPCASPHRLLGVHAVRLRLRLNTHKRTQAQSPITAIPLRSSHCPTRARCRLPPTSVLGPHVNSATRVPVLSAVQVDHGFVDSPQIQKADLSVCVPK